MISNTKIYYTSEKLNVSTTYLHDIPHVVDTELVCRGDNGYKGGFPHDTLNPCRGIQCAHDTPPRHAKCNPRHAPTTCYPRHGMFSGNTRFRNTCFRISCFTHVLKTCVMKTCVTHGLNHVSHTK